MEKQIFVLDDLMDKEWDLGDIQQPPPQKKKSPDQGEEERSQMIGWDPKTEVGTPSRQRKQIIRKLVVGQGSWRTELKPRTPGKRRRKISSSKY